MQGYEKNRPEKQRVIIFLIEVHARSSKFEVLTLGIKKIKICRIGIFLSFGTPACPEFQTHKKLVDQILTVYVISIELRDASLCGISNPQKVSRSNS